MILFLCFFFLVAIFPSDANIAGDIQFKIDVAKFSSSQCVESSEILLNNLKFIFKLCQGDGDVRMHLIANPIIKTPHWTCDFDATIKLIARQVNFTDHVTNLNDLAYSNVENSHIVDSFMSVLNFESGYVRNNIATFDIELSMSPLETRQPSTEVVRSYEKLYFKLENLSRFHETISSNITVHGVKWRVRLEKSLNNLVASLIADPNDFDASSTYNVVGVFKILSFDGSRATVERKFTHKFGRRKDSVRMLLLNLKSNQSIFYIKNGCANIVFEFDVRK